MSLKLIVLAAPELANAPRLATTLAPVSAAPPTEDPVRLVAMTTPASLMEPEDVRVVVLPAELTAPFTAKTPPAVVVKLVAPVAPAALVVPVVKFPAADRLSVPVVAVRDAALVSRAPVLVTVRLRLAVKFWVLLRVRACRALTVKS